MTAPLVFEPRPAGTIQKRNETISSTGNRISLRGNRPALGAHVAECDFIRQAGHDLRGGLENLLVWTVRRTRRTVSF